MPLITRYFTLIILALSLAFSANSYAEQAAHVNPADYQGVIKLACVGDSITQGVGAAGGQSWPDQIKKMLGEKWAVKNFGVSGATLLNTGDKPYQKEGAFTKALEFTPDVVVIMLGTNDTKAQNWVHKDTFAADYQNLIGKFAALSSKPRIFICYPPYISGEGKFGINEANTLAEFPMIDAAAKATKSTIIDVHAALAGKDALIPDRVHPNTEGATAIATAVFQGLTGTSAK